VRIGAFIQRSIRSALSRALCRTLYLTRRIRLSYLPPLTVYLAAGISGLTGIAGTFFVKDYLDLPAEFLAMLGFWVGLPWAFKMPLGHLVDLIWKWKSLLVFLGATLIAASLTIMLILIQSPSLLYTSMSMESWFVLVAMLSPIGYVLQDVVADAMTVEALPTVDEDVVPLDSKTIKSLHTTMQTLGRCAIVGGGIGDNVAPDLGVGDHEHLIVGRSQRRRDYEEMLNGAAETGNQDIIALVEGAVDHNHQSRSQITQCLL
jgi:hypothetical protein